MPVSSIERRVPHIWHRVQQLKHEDKQLEVDNQLLRKYLSKETKAR
jgi:hypothetical protein